MVLCRASSKDKKWNFEAKKSLRRIICVFMFVYWGTTLCCGFCFHLSTHEQKVSSVCDVAFELVIPYYWSTILTLHLLMLLHETVSLSPCTHLHHLHHNLLLLKLHINDYTNMKTLKYYFRMFMVLLNKLLYFNPIAIYICFFFWYYCNNWN